MVKVIVTGAGGRMGTRLVSLIKETPNLQLVGAVEQKGHPAVGADAGETAGCGRLGVAVTDNLAALADRAQVLIEFTSPDATLMHLAIMAASRKAMVIGTTGFSAEQLAGLRERSEEHTSELQSLAYLVCRLLLAKKKSCTETDARA